MLPLQKKGFSAELLSRAARVQAPSVLSLDNALAPMKGSTEINGGTLRTHNLFCSANYVYVFISLLLQRIQQGLIRDGRKNIVGCSTAN